MARRSPPMSRPAASQPRTRALPFLLALALLGAAAPLPAGTCTVPGSHATLQAALDDALCDTLALAAQSYAESLRIERDVTLDGPDAGGAVLAGRLTAAGGVVVAVRDLAVQNSCKEGALRSIDGARLEALRVAVRQDATFTCPRAATEVFADGFEKGDTGRWTSSSPLISIPGAAP